jgi:hypothetical protein
VSDGEAYVKNDTHAGLIIRLVLIKHNTRPRLRPPAHCAHHEWKARLQLGLLGACSYEYARRDQCRLLKTKHRVLAMGII